MTKEEKKAIERIEDIIYKRDETNYADDREITLYEDDIQKISKLLNLIDKQQEEIELLKNAEEYAKLGKETLLDAIHKQQKEIEELKQENENLTLHILDNTKYIKDTISKDKIKEKIEEREKQKEEVPHEMDFRAFYRISDLKEVEIGALKELLEEE